MPDVGNRLALKKQEPSIQEGSMAMGSLDADNSLIESYNYGFNLVSALGGRNIRVATKQVSRRTIPLTINDFAATSTPAEVVKQVIRPRRDSFGQIIISGQCCELSPLVSSLSNEQKEFILEAASIEEEITKLRTGIQGVEVLAQALDGKNVRVATKQVSRRTIPLTINDFAATSTPAEVVKQVIRPRRDSFGQIIIISGQCCELSPLVSSLSNEQKNIFLRFIDAQKLDRASDEFQDAAQAFKRLQDNNQIQQNFFDLIDKKLPFEGLIQFLGNLEERDQQDRALVAKLTAYAYIERRKQFIQNIYSQLGTPSPNFDAIFAELAFLGKSPSEADKKLALNISRQASKCETVGIKRRILGRINLSTPRDVLIEEIRDITLRPTVPGGVDYVLFVQNLKEEVSQLYEKISTIQILAQTTDLRNNFTQLSASKVFAQIDNIVANSKSEILIKNALLEEYRRALESKTGMMTSDIQEQIQRRIGVVLDGEYETLELGSNDAAKNYMMENFGRTFFTLFQSLRGNPAVRKGVENYIIGRDENGEKIRNQFVQSLQALKAQRPLTDIEKTYIQSVEQLTKFNPYIVGLANESLGITDEFLRNHFDTLSSSTWEGLSNGSYLPAIQIGTGPNGLSFFGEIARYKPELAAQILVVDQGKQPGGPFAVPGGPAWELNSANRRGKRQAVMPDSPGIDEAKTVRAYGSPVTRWYPGERRVDQDIRQGGINTTVDYLPTPDELSTLRYPTNEEFQIILASQGAMLFRNIVLKTNLETVEPNEDLEQEGDYKVVLTQKMADGRTETKTLYTDAVINASGLGEDFLGFELKGSRAEKVIDATKRNKVFPKVSSTLKAFEASADRRLSNAKPPRVIAMNGTGNSTDVMIEYFTELFASGNPLVRNVEKIYIIGEGELSARPRYARINDVKGRNGKGNIIEFITGRVGDVDFVDLKTKDPEKEPLLILDESGRPLTDDDGKVIQAEAFIGNAGFRSKSDKVYKKFIPSGESLNIKANKRPTDPLILPTNKEVAVAESLAGNPNILFVGTSSNPRFDSLEKLAQLPVSAREALLRNGAENAVAVGFRAPDSQAAARLFLGQRDLNLPENTNHQIEEVIISMEGVETLSEWDIPITIDPNRLSVANNVDSEDDMLSALSAYDLSRVKLIDKNGQAVTGNINLIITKLGNSFNVKINNDSTIAASEKVANIISRFVANIYFQNYALSGLKKKRKSPQVKISLDFRNGCIRPKESFAQIS